MMEVKPTEQVDYDSLLDLDRIDAPAGRDGDYSWFHNKATGNHFKVLIKVRYERTDGRKDLAPNLRTLIATASCVDDKGKAVRGWNDLPIVGLPFSHTINDKSLEELGEAIDFNQMGSHPVKRAIFAMENRIAAETKLATFHEEFGAIEEETSDPSDEEDDALIAQIEDLRE